MGHREDLLAGAKRCLYDKGYARTTARDIVAASGTNLGSIGYHYGSTAGLMNAAMLSAIEDWGDAIGEALSAEITDESDDPMVRYWRRVIGTIGTHRELWLASIEAMLQSEHAPELKAQIAAGLEQGRSGLAAVLLGREEDSLDERTIRSVGSVSLALMSGVMTQWLTDPEHAPSAEQIAEGVRALSLSPALPPSMNNPWPPDAVPSRAP
ncbi:TetR/AcrR family transcriptional regulator [Actinoplanes friuliensis]|jgi:AcrR family transcriptional regulator|uniref:Putative TetR-family transcriptional regulator n=1 Tax=Actinoplanes friuliensis DSM 7358 TaxID=1246995 RepID=U5W967_9ACTN|nr:TetR/AcrR family transcriptional regulator [Actinoplanes friuliensis]AGZ44486.1 putative TetR-family transcriptional regulator [Actinoplanes friuliensis DSM 7358]